MNTIEVTKNTAKIALAIKNSLFKSMTYGDYRNLVANLVANNKSTGEVQNDDLANYTMLNHKRMQRLDKTLEFSESVIAKIKKIDKKMTWLVLTESWCGDAAQTMPVMNKLASFNENIAFKVVLRDENLDLMNHYLYNGTLSIPKLIILDAETNNVIADWGPRPAIATKMVQDFKKEFGALTQQFKQNLQMWYTKDKGQSTAEDILSCLLLK
tara:strand:- start:889 stop:1524 length:636 start_codon:yes stop_codon:yes gene_type:complete